MGDGADMALDYAMSTWEEAMDYQDAPLQEKYERGLCDDSGRDFNPGPRIAVRGFVGGGRYLPKGPCGEGPCPECGCETIWKTGRYGGF